MADQKDIPIAREALCRALQEAGLTEVPVALCLDEPFHRMLDAVARHRQYREGNAAQ